MSALASCRPIVTPSWLEAASQCFSEGKALPNPADYQPKVVDANLDEGSFRPDYRRRTLFQDRMIYFLCEKQVGDTLPNVQCTMYRIYSRKLSREKSFTNLSDLRPFVTVFSTKFYISRIRESFLPRKFHAIRYMYTCIPRLSRTILNSNLHCTPSLPVYMYIARKSWSVFRVGWWQVRGLQLSS